MKLVRTVIYEIAQSDGDISADDIVSAVLDKMCAHGATQEACDDIRERLIGIAICALKLMADPDLVTEWQDAVWDEVEPELEPVRRVLH